MSRQNDDREGLSPSPANVLDYMDEDDDEDDDLYEPATEQSDLTASTAEDDEEIEFTDAQEQPEIEVVFEGLADANGNDDDDGEGEETETETQNNAGTAHQGVTMTIEDLSRILGGHGPLRRLLMQRYENVAGGGRLIIDDDDDDDGDYTYNNAYRRRRRRPKLSSDRFPKIPSEAGKMLMTSGLYGSRDTHVDIRRRRRRNMSERLMWRRLGLDPRPSMSRQNCLIAQELIPSTSIADKIIHYDSRAYSGQFSDDGNFFFSCTQNFKVRMYDTSNPYEWNYYKTVDFPFGQWTITDATLSPDNRWLAYSSIRHTVCLASTDPLDTSDYTLLDFADFAPGATLSGSRRGNHGYRGHSHFGIWSLRFSGDGREIVAGTSDHSVVVYDLETRKSTVRLSNHEDDVNAVCFGDKMSPHILYSGSDDQTLRVWDRRSMADGREAGVFVGHTEGLTYVDSKGDGRYVLSNGKDQMMKLWDLRKMMSPNDFSKVNLNDYTSNFDYRFSPYDEDDYTPNPHDCSVVTFRGHSVLKTLIRCHFSPPTSSNSRYVYSGSEDGKVYIWNLDGTRKAEVDVLEATKNTRPRHSAREEMFMYEMHGSRGGESWKTCVRDASWCPTAPVLAATSWNGYGMSTGTVTLHTWSGNPAATEDDADDPPMGANYNARLDRKEEFDAARRGTRYPAGNGNAGGGAGAGAGDATLGGRRTLRSHAVWARRRGGNAADDGEDGASGGAGW